MNIRYEKFSPHTKPSPEVMARLVELYRDVFAAPPWNEWLKCPKCDTYWGTKDGEKLVSMGYMHSGCDVPLVDFWSREAVLRDFHELVDDSASCWLAFDGNELVGFVLGYQIKVSQLERKLGLEPEAWKDLVANLEEKFDSLNNLAYLHDLGVLDKYRGASIGKNLVARRNDDLAKMGMTAGITRVRRSPEPSVTYLWYPRYGFEVVYAYPETDGRVLLGRKFEGLSTLLLASS